MQIIDLTNEDTVNSDVQALLDRIKEDCEMDHIAYCGIDPTRGFAFGAVTYPEDWKNFYNEQNFVENDATLQVAMRSIAPVDWSRLEQFASHKALMNAASDFGIKGQGVTIPTRGPFGEVGLLSVTRDCSANDWENHLKRNLGTLHSLAVNFHDNIMEGSTALPMIRRPSLSSREIEALQWAACGKNQQDIGVILGISPRTVELHLRSCREKLNALTTAQAVARGIAQNLIYPD